MQALKEWAIVCKALEEGRQILILRKGGILEYKSGFEVKHEEFLLYPTYEHQSKNHIQQDYAQRLDGVLKEQPADGTNKMTSYAQVIGIKEITDRVGLKMLAKYHIWNESYVNARMDYNPKRPMSVILLHVFKLDKALFVHTKPEWAGCKSWIPVDLDVKGTPAIDDLQFNRISSELSEVLTRAS